MYEVASAAAQTNALDDESPEAAGMLPHTATKNPFFSTCSLFVK